jgi:Ran GTPase-activating protein (RanGAP) involved in mRNA processing and transport
VRAICQWLEINKTILFLELLDNRITPLGCEFIGRIFSPKVSSPIHTLKLDHNDIGAEGVKHLSEGLAVNKTLKSLSLTYCNIDYLGARPLFEIIVYTKSQLTSLDLTGNHLRNEGIVDVMRGVQIAKTLERLVVADNQFGEEEIVLNAFKKSMIKNQVLGKYDLRFNAVYNEGT